MNIVMVRGTSGSGKTWLVRAVMKQCDVTGTLVGTHPVNGREIVTGYIMYTPSGRELVVLGRYGKSACGGCDSMSWRGSADFLCDLVHQHHRLNRGVLMEGLIVSTWGLQRLRDLNEDTGGAVHLAYLDTSLEDCLASVRARRVAAGNTRPLNTANTEGKWHAAIRTRPNVAATGVGMHDISRKNGAEIVMGLLDG